jgi:hypothetical protein
MIWIHEPGFFSSQCRGQYADNAGPVYLGSYGRFCPCPFLLMHKLVNITAHRRPTCGNYHGTGGGHRMGPFIQDFLVLADN